MQMVKSVEENRTTFKERKADCESRDDKNIIMHDGWKAIRILENIGLQNGRKILCLKQHVRNFMKVSRETMQIWLQFCK
jgi:hypothetical protein